MGDVHVRGSDLGRFEYSRSRVGSTFGRPVEMVGVGVSGIRGIGGDLESAGQPLGVPKSPGQLPQRE